MAEHELIQGDSFDLSISDEECIDLSEFTCQLQVRDSSGTLAGVDREVITYGDNDTYFAARLTTTETSALTVGQTYTVSAQVTHETDGRSFECRLNVLILEQKNY